MLVPNPYGAFDPRGEAFERLRIAASSYHMPQKIIDLLLEIGGSVIEPGIPTDEELQVGGITFLDLLANIVDEMSWQDKMLKLYRQRIIATVWMSSRSGWREFRTAALRLAANMEAEHETTDYKTAAALLLVLRTAWLPRS